MKDSFSKARAVFLGEVTKVVPGEERDPIYGGMFLYVAFRVERFWKGVKGESIEVLAMVPAACGGPTYEVGRSYLVYAYGKELETGGCTRSRRREDAGEDFAFLGKGKVPKPKKG